MEHQPETKSAVVLLVEDELLVRMLGVDVLEEAGFEVIEAKDSTIALEILRSRSDIRALVTDVEMPGDPDGYGLAHYSHENWPEIGIVVISGGKTPVTGDMPEGAAFFSKPYEHDALVRQVRVAAGVRPGSATKTPA